MIQINDAVALGAGRSGSARRASRTPARGPPFTRLPGVAILVLCAMSAGGSWRAPAWPRWRYGLPGRVGRDVRHER